MPIIAPSERPLLPLTVAAVAFALAAASSASTFLPLATRAGFLAGLVFGGSVVTRAGVGEFGGVGAGVGSSGIVSSGCGVAMVSILRCSEFYKVCARFLVACCQVPARLLPGPCQVPSRGFTLHQGLRVDNLPCLCWGVALVLVCAGPSSLGVVAQVSPQAGRVWL